MSRHHLSVKSTVLGIIGSVPVFTWLVSGMSSGFLAPVLLIGFPSLGLSGLLAGLSLIEEERSPTDARSQREGKREEITGSPRKAA